MIINGKEYNRENLGKIFDYALLSPDVTKDKVEAHLQRAIKYNVSGVNCNPYWLPLVADTLEGTGIEAGIVPSFPMGCDATYMKLRQIEEYCKMLKGRPSCVDAVTNVGLLKGGDYKGFTEDIREIVKLSHSYGYDVKSILETTLLTDQEIAIATQCVCEAGVDYVKVATGRTGSSDMRVFHIIKDNISGDAKMKHAAMGTINVTEQTIMGLAMGVSMFGTGYAHQIIEEIETYYKDLVINTK